MGTQKIIFFYKMKFSTRFLLVLVLFSVVLELTDAARKEGSPRRNRPGKRKRIRDPNRKRKPGRGGGKRRRTKPANPVTSAPKVKQAPVTKPKIVEKPRIVENPRIVEKVIPAVVLTGVALGAAKTAHVVWDGPSESPGEHPKSCHQIFEDNAKKCERSVGGAYLIQPAEHLKPKYVECIFDDERGWTVIQNRYAGDVCFNRNWNQYSAGFGCPTGIGALPDWYTNGATSEKVSVSKSNTSMCPNAYTSPYHDEKNEYDPVSYPNTYRGPMPRNTDILPECNGELWLGLEYMFWVQTAHGINGTKLCNFIRGPSPSMDPQNYKYVCYDQFQIGDVGTDYAILTADEYDIDLEDINNGFRGGDNNSGGPTDLLGAKFSTSDHQTNKGSRNCAKESESGWWFKDCSSVNLNGLYHGARTEKNTYDVKTGKPTNPTPADGIFWRHESKRWDSLRQTKMFISAKTVVEYPCLYER